jgi:hypothetical protein
MIICILETEFLVAALEYKIKYGFVTGITKQIEQIKESQSGIAA